MNDESTMKCEFPASIEIEIFERFENAEPSIKSTSRGIIIDLRAENENAFDSMRRNRESCSNEIDESDWQDEKHDEQTISILFGIVTLALQPKYRINFMFDESKMKCDLTTKCKLFDAIEIDIL
jgi:hypothetical protein